MNMKNFKKNIIQLERKKIKSEKENKTNNKNEKNIIINEFKNSKSINLEIKENQENKTKEEDNKKTNENIESDNNQIINEEKKTLEQRKTITNSTELDYIHYNDFETSSKINEIICQKKKEEEKE